MNKYNATRLLGLFSLLLILPMATQAFAATATVTSARVTGANQVTIVFSDPLDFVIGDFTDLNINGVARTIDSVSVAPSATVTITFSGGPAVGVASTGDIDIGAIADGGSGNDFAGVTNQILSDGQAPPAPVLSYSGVDPTNADPVQFSVDFGEDVSAPTFNAGDITVSSGTIVNILDTGDGQNFTFDVSTPTDGATLSVQVTGDVDDLAGNTGSADSNIETVDIDYTGPVITPVSISSSNADPMFAKNGDTITVSITGGETLSNVVGTIDGEVATIVNTIGDTWTASLTLSGDETEGVTAFSISVDDSLGNTSTVTATTDASSVTIDLTVPLVIGSTTNINDGGSTVKTLADQYTESCSATDVNPASPACTVQSGFIDTSVLGLQSVIYEATDSAGNVGIDTVSTTIVTGNAPVIVLSGANPQTINLHDAYVELGATASDTEDGDLTGSIVIDASSVDVDTLGSYIVTYDVTDSSGNTDHEERTVNVVTGDAPVITILGANPVNLDWGATYIDSGATASDTEDGDLTGSIVTTGLPIDTFIIGGYQQVLSYSVTYTVTDSNGNTVQASRIVNVGYKPAEGDSCGGDCYHPHFGVDQNGVTFYEDGLRVNNVIYKIDNILHNHPDRIIELPVGVPVHFALKASDNYASQIRHMELALGIQKGHFDKQQASIIIDLDIDFQGNYVVSYEGDATLVRDVTSKVSILDKTVLWDLVFTPTQHLQHDMFAISVVDEYQYVGTYYINEGITFRGISQNGIPEFTYMDSRGHPHILTIADTTLEDLSVAVDEQGNKWTIDDTTQFWMKEYIRPDMTGSLSKFTGYDRNDYNEFKVYKQGQALIAAQKFDSSKIQGELEPSKTYDYPSYERGHNPVPNMIKAYIDYAKSRAGHS